MAPPRAAARVPAMRNNRTTAVEVVVGLLSIWVIAALALTASLVVIGGAFVLGDPTVRIVLGAMLLAAVVFLVHQHRHRVELLRDPRLRLARERRGF